jgi:prolyl oligopeptidase
MLFSINIKGMVMSRRTRSATLVWFTTALTWASLACGQQLKYPQTRRGDHVDVYHGTEVADPYRWLEEDVRQSTDVAEWIEAQNRVTFGHLESISERDVIRKRLERLWNYERYLQMFKRGGRYYFLKNDGLQNQDVVYVQDSLDAPARVLIDPNGWSEDGTVALGGLSFSDDGRYAAFARAEAGSDWTTWRVLEIDSGRVLDDEVKWVKWSDASWTTDSRGFFYSRYGEPDEGAEYQQVNLNQKVYYHRVGTNQSEDVLVYSRPDEPTWGFGAEVTEDGRYLVITVWKGTDDKYRILVRDLQEPYAIPVEVIDNFENEYTFVGNDGPVFYFQTDLDAPKRRLIAMDVRDPRPEAFTQIIPEAEEPLTAVRLVGNLFVTSYLKDAKTQVKIFRIDGRFLRNVELPAIGSAWGFGGRRTDTETFYSFESFAAPRSIYRYDLITGESQLLHRATVDFQPADYEVKQVFCQSKDGTRVPMFIVHRKGLQRDGSNPTLLYGYGGFGISLTPRFSVTRLAWIEMGGVFAVPNLRGGGEYGDAWHRGGTKLNKQNVFDDFIAAAEWLVEQGYTRPQRLAIQGGSNGGLLVGAVMTQRPDLFGAALPAVGVMDMLRFHTFTAGRFWVDDYGSSEDPEEFKALMAYSPYHNLDPDTAYPATLITTADTDDRVVPAHSFKFAAALQHAHAGQAPVLIRIETRAGHGGGKPTTKRIEEAADQLAFLAGQFEMNATSPDN